MRSRPTVATASPSDPAGVAGLVLGLAAARPPTLGSGRLVCVDGPAGSGKTTLAAALASARPDATVLHMDDLYDGWSGLAAGIAQLEGLLTEHAAGRPGQVRRYDWHAGRYAETVHLDPVRLLVVEGVGAGAVGHADLTGVLAWVVAPDDTRLQRGLERDGPAVESHWRRWLTTEARHFAEDRTAERADLIVDGLGLAAPVVR
ncbi:uridine kinase family protein [Nocardioides ferulae]|uniref:uridine kinase family protein n=1 Tax=Nocardioides ferulae TaxID=2340821 RepID=UPI001F0C011F|nr:4-amino-4-deoxy-L-arabinose transferase [Nocardioides ferulae]